MCFRRVVIAITLIASLCAFCKEPEWRTAKVISQEFQSSNGGAAAMPIGTMIVAVPINRISNIVVLDTETHRITLSEIGRKQIVLPVNENVRFYLDKGRVIFIDSNGKKHKFAIVGMVKEETPAK
jgi:hypothetical protein